MKATITKAKPEGFQPINLNIQISSKEELNAWGAFFNTSCVIDTLNDIGALGKNANVLELSSVLAEAGADIHGVKNPKTPLSITKVIKNHSLKYH